MRNYMSRVVLPTSIFCIDDVVMGSIQRLAVSKILEDLLIPSKMSRLRRYPVTFGG
jgi:hypothetical protein